MRRVADTLRGPLAALAFLVAYALLGMAVVIPVAVLLMRDGPARGGLPSADAGAMLLLVSGLAANGLMAFAVPEGWLSGAFRPLAEARVLPSANVRALLAGDPVAPRFFGLELLGACGIAVTAWTAVLRPGAWQAAFLDGLKRRSEVRDGKTDLARLYAAAALVLMLTAGYLLHPGWGRRANGLALVLPVTPFIGLIAVSALTVLGRREQATGIRPRSTIRSAQVRGPKEDTERASLRRRYGSD